MTGVNRPSQLNGFQDGAGDFSFALGEKWDAFVKGGGAAKKFAPILTAIGNTIVQKKGTFTLSRAPTSQEQTIVNVVHANGSSTTIPTSNYTVTGTTLQITDLNTVLSLASTDTINIYYQPSTVF